MIHKSVLNKLIRYSDTLVLHSGIEKPPGDIKIEWQADGTTVSLIKSKDTRPEIAAQVGCFGFRFIFIKEHIAKRHKY